MLEGPPPHLTVRLRHRIGTLDLNVAFQLRHPWTVLFGPSGSGKSTILRAIAGLLRPDHARIVVTSNGGTSLERSHVLVDTGAGIFLPPHQRCIPLAPQQPSLFPHLTVAQNLAYPIRPEPQHDREPGIALFESFHIANLADRLPSQLSGGQAQRVVLARTAAAHSRLILLDEPFTGLELPLRDELIDELRRPPANGVPRNILSVTHDVAEAFQLGAEVIELHEGRIVAQGPTAEVLRTHRDCLLTQLGTDRSEILSSPEAPNHLKTKEK